MGTGVKSNANERYGFFNTYINGGLSLHSFHRLIGGVTLFTDRPFSSLSDSNLGFTLGYQIIVGKIGFSLQPGWYLNAYDGDTRYYQVMLQYRLKPHVFLQTSLRATSDFFAEDLAFGIGYEI